MVCLPILVSANPVNTASFQALRSPVMCSDILSRACHLISLCLVYINLSSAALKAGGSVGCVGVF